MADYAVQADLERAAGGSAKLVALTDLEKTGSLDTTTMDKAIEDASRLIDGYVDRRYLTPLDTVPASIRRLTAREAVYILKGDRDAIDDRAQEIHGQDVEYLEGVRDGRINPGLTPLPSSSSAVTATTGVRDINDPDRVTRYSLRGYW